MSVPEPSPVSVDADPVAQVARPLLVFGSAVYLAGWLLVDWAHPDLPDPLWLRLAIVALMLGLLALGPLSGWVRRNRVHLLALVQWVVTGHQLWLVHASGMASPPLLATLSLLGAVSAFATYTHATPAALLVYLVAAIAGAAAVVIATPGGDPMFVLAVVALSVVIWLGATSHWRHREQLRRDAEVERDLHARLLQADKLAALGTIVAGVAHEVTNPLTLVLANLEVLDAELERASPELRAALRDAREGAERVRDIIVDLRAHSRPGGDSVGPVEVNAVVEAAIDLLGVELTHRCEVVRRLEPVPPVLGHPTRLGQVVLNLLQNAVQALPDGREGRLEVRSRREGPLVVLEVEDDGPGVPPDIRSRIFEPFFTTRVTAGGTGLGLFVCHRIVTALGGTIEALDAPGGGARFRVCLPAAPERAPVDAASRVGLAPERPADPPRGPLRVLVVDDDVAVARAIGRALRDHEVAVARNGREALEQLRDARFDLVLCDLAMPEMGGPELWDAVRRERPGEEGRLVFVTGGPLNDQTRRFLEQVPNRTVLKPIDRTALRSLIAAHLDRVEPS